MQINNPSKSDIGKISKQILDKINFKIISETKLNQWKNSTSVIEWFNNIPNKNQHRFVVFDIEIFYPSISEDLFNEALSFAKTKANNTDQEMSIITQSRNTLLFNKSQPWVKRLEMKSSMYQWGASMGLSCAKLLEYIY